MIPRLGCELIASLSSAEVSERLALVATQSRGHPRRADQLWEEEKKTQKNNALCMYARPHTRAESHGEMWRLTSGLHTALPAACRLVLSATQPCTCKRSADPGAGQCADREKTAPATFAPAPKYALSPTEVCCTAAVHSTRFFCCFSFQLRDLVLFLCFFFFN